MVVSYVEEITEAWCRNSNFLTMRDVPFRVRRKGKQFGWSDIDVLATNKRETRIISCKHWIHKNNIKPLIKNMLEAKEYVLEIKNLMGLSENLKMIFVVDVWKHGDRSKLLFEQKGIEVKRLKEILEELFVSLSKGYIRRDHQFGKETNLVSRLLMCLFFNDLVPEEIKVKVYEDYINQLRKELNEGKLSSENKNQMYCFLNKISINRGKEIQKYNKKEYKLHRAEKKYVIFQIEKPEKA